MRVINDRTGQVQEIPDDQLAQMGINVSQLQNNSQPNNLSNQPQQQGGFLSSILSSLANPFVKTGKTIGAAGYELESKLANILGLDNKKGQTFDPTRANPFLSKDQNANYNGGQEFVNQLGRSAAIASYTVPFGGQGASAFGKSIFPAVTKAPGMAAFAGKFLVPGALAGGAQAAGQADNPTLNKILGGAGIGAAGAGILGGLGNIYSKGASSLADDAAGGISQATPSNIEKTINQKGVNPNDLINKYVPSDGSVKNFDDLLGPVSARGKGGLFGQHMSNAEATIQDAVKSSGDKIVASKQDLLTPLYQQRSALANTVGNGEKIQALDAAIQEAETKFAKGATAQQLLDLDRLANKTFGRAVVEDTKGAITNQVQKMLGNTARGILKDQVPATRDALQTQSHMFTLQDLVGGARSKALSSPATNPVKGFDLARPGSWLGAPYNNALSNPAISSKFLNNGADKTSQSLVSKILSGATSPKTGAILGGNLGATLFPNNQTPQPNQDPSSQINGQSDQNIGNQVAPSISQGVKSPINDSLTGATINGQPIDPGMAELIRKVANYQVDISKVTSLRSDQRQKLAEYVSQYDPSWDQTQYAARASLRKDFTSGKSAANIRSLNTAVGHLQSLSDAGSKLNNSSLPLLNSVKNTVSTRTGESQVNNFNNAVNAVAGEMSQVFKGTGATDEEIKSWKQQMNSSQSPKQIQDGINTMIELMGSRLGAFDSQWNAGINKPRDFAILSPRSRTILQKLGVDVNQLDPINQ